MEDFFYLVINGKSEGPFTRQQLINMPLTPDTLVWKKGLPEWVKASQVPELQDILFSNPNHIPNPDIPYGFRHQTPEERIWFMIVNGNQEGPFTISEVISRGIEPTTPLWRAGLENWDDARNHPEFNDYFSGKAAGFHDNPNRGGFPRFGETNPHYSNPSSGTSSNSPYNQGNNYRYNQNGYGNGGSHNHDHHYGHGGQGWNNNYDNGYKPHYEENGRYGRNMPTNWLPWAIVGTIVGCLFSCIGLIFGIIAIVQANKANNLYMMNENREGDRVNSNAKTMTIISFVFAAVGLIFGAFMFGNGIFNYL